MEKTFAKAEEMVNTVKDYIHTRVETVKLGVAEKTSKIIANMVAGIAVAFLFFLCMIFAGIALSVALGEWTGKPWAGFLLVAVLYLLIAVTAWAARGKLIRLPVMNALLQQFFHDDEEDKKHT